ncbi:hypothetical protein M422DRAFT_71251 [Sphaerobolus stellatus SS14]|uniref:Unplaced genomic scaffold SPHSTscaffold_211, whole genome shotgun sequence n=1 Tax=Sphaerobolus stellatus (strain SS14) TaxID=990650 RepID=A0A0C9TID4_SPHS4|nr:hypothetical protein M422DRAFT_71251 [Sphaerobolus stellatus SS14]
MQAPQYMKDGVTPTPSDFTDEETNVLNTTPTPKGEAVPESEDDSDVTDEGENDDSAPLKVPPGNKYVVFSFIRHGESRENATGAAPKENDILTDEGHQQAENLAIQWANLRIDALYSSDLNRARDTASKISKYNRCNPGLTLTKALKEKNHGHLYTSLKEQGRFAEAKKARRGGYKGAVPRHYRPEGGESYDDVLDRGLAILFRLAKRHGVYLPSVPKELDAEYQPTGELFELPENVPHVVLVSHNIFLSQLYKALSTWNEDRKPILPNSKYDNTGWTRHLIRLGNLRSDHANGPLDREFHFDIEIKHLRWIELADNASKRNGGVK